MTKAEFHILLVNSSKLSFDFAKSYVSDNLPNDFKYTVKLNFSHDDPNLKQFDVYPSDNDKTIELISAKEVVELLCRNNKVPVWVDISVESISNNHTVFQLLCAGRYSEDTNEFYYQKGGTGPFGIKSPVFPIGYKDDGTKFSLHKNEMKNSFKNALKIFKYLSIIFSAIFWIYMITDDYIFIEKYGLTMDSILLWFLWFLVYFLGLAFYYWIICSVIIVFYYKVIKQT